MSNIEVGEYVRTKGGYIAKVLSIAEPRSIISSFSGRKVTYQSRYWIDNKSGSVTKSYIVNHSKNKIDLIEVGDYVNGEKVIRLFNPTFLSMGELPYLITEKNKFEEYEIKSIVTKEMFLNAEYKVGE